MKKKKHAQKKMKKYVPSLLISGFSLRVEIGNISREDA